MPGRVGTIDYVDCFGHCGVGSLSIDVGLVEIMLHALRVRDMDRLLSRQNDVKREKLRKRL